MPHADTLSAANDPDTVAGVSDGVVSPNVYGRIQLARHSLAGFVREAYTSRQFVMPKTDAAKDQVRSGSDHIPNRLVEGLIASVADHMRAWLRSSEPPLGEEQPLLHIYADHTIWRAILESLASAIWMIAPATSEERVKRGVSLALYEWKATGPVERPNHANDEAAAQTKNELRRIIERVCHRMDWDVADLEKRHVTPSLIVKGAQQSIGPEGRQLFYWWTICSRYAHAQTLTVILRARRTHVNTPYGGGVDVETDEELVADLIEFAVGVLNVFTALTRERGLLRVRR